MDLLIEVLMVVGVGAEMVLYLSFFVGSVAEFVYVFRGGDVLFSLRYLKDFGVDRDSFWISFLP